MDPFARLGQRVSNGTELFYLARVCASREHADLANRLAAKAKQTLNQRRKEKLGLIDALAEDLSHSKTWKAFVRFGNTKVSRKELLTEFREIFRFYPQNKHRKRVQQTIVMLERMIREDEVHAKSPIQNPSRQQQIADLIFRLRDQNGQQWSQPGSCDIFSGDRFAKGSNIDPSKRSPAWQLREIGFDAVPKLIEVLDDKTFTRSVGYHRNFYFSHRVLRVGDCAERIIADIAGRGFYQRKHTNGAMQKDGAVGTVKEQIEQWWAEIDGKGEQQVLVEAVIRGDHTSGAQAQRLADRYPKPGLDAIKQGLQNTQSDWTRTNLIQATRKLKDPAVLDLLVAQMGDASDLQSRVTAAEELFKRKHQRDVVIETMMRQWADYRKKGDTLNELRRIVWLFQNTDSPKAIDLVASDFANLPTSLRLDVVSDLGELLGEGNGFEPRLSKETLSRIESLLVNATKDTQKRMGLSGSRNGMTYQDPRICDFAGYFLAQRDEYSFDMTTSLARRDLALAKIRNTFRAKQANHR